MKNIFFIGLILFITNAIKAQQPESAYQQAWQALRESRFDDGLQHIDYAAKLYAAKKMPDSLAQALALKATITWEKLEWTDAKLVIDTAMHITFHQLPKISSGRVYLNAVAGSLYASQYHFDTAKLYYNLAMQAADTLRPSLPLVILYNNLSKMSLLQNSTVQAALYYQKAYDYAVALEGKDGRLIADIMPVQMQYYITDFKYKEALASGLYLEQLITKYYGHDNIKQARNYANLSAVYYYLSRYEDALLYRRKALHIYEAYKAKGVYNPAPYYVTYYNMGQLYHYLNEPALASQYLDKALLLGYSLYGRQNLAMIPMLVQYATALQKMKQFNEAHRYFREAHDLQYLIDPENHSELAYIESFHADLFSDEEKYDSSIVYYSRAAERYKRIGEAYSYYGIFNSAGMADILSTMGNTKQALVLQKEILMQMRHYLPDLQQPVIEFLNDIAATYSRTTHLDSALCYSDSVFLYQSTLKTLSPNVADWLPGIPFNYKNCERIKTRTKILSGLYRQSADKKYLEQLAALVTAYSDYVSANLYMLRTQSSLVEQSSLNKEIFAAGIDACWLLSEKNKNSGEWLKKAFVFSEQSKALLLRLASNSFLVDEGLSGDDMVVQKDIALKKTLSSLNEQYLNAETGKDSLLQVLTTSIEQYKFFQDSLKNIAHPYFKKRYDLSNYTLETIRKKLLTNNKILVEYALTQEGLYTFVITTDSFYCQRQNPSVIKEVKYLQQPQSLTPAVFASHSMNLYHALLKPIEPYFNSRQLIIIPDADLYYLNFETLVTNNKGTDFARLQYAIHTYNISYLLSANTALQLEDSRPGNTRNNKALVFAPVFTDAMKAASKKQADTDSSFLTLYRQPFALQAAKDIQNIVPADVFLEQKAVEDHFKKSASQYKVLHLGTHAQLNDEDPLRSKLFFAKGDDTAALVEDGNLYAYEIYPMQLRAQLAVLTACETGAGTVQSGEGVMSLAYSFLYAGCPSVVMSLWKIDEKTNTAIITHFYKNLKNGDSKSDALRKAKLQFLQENSGELANPFYWAGLCLIGSDEPVYPTNTAWYWLAGLVVLIAALAFLRFKKRNKSVTV